MSFLQLDLPAEQVVDKTVRRALIDAILERTPTGPGRGQRSARKARKVGEALGVKVATDGGSAEVLHALGIPAEWAERCEDAAHVGHDGTNGALAERLDWLRANQFSNFLEKVTQLGSYGGGNHFGECEVVQLGKGERAREVGQVFGLRDGCVGFLSHCGSRGFGHALASGQFRALQQKFAAWNIPLPGEDKELVYAPLGTPEADKYLDDVALGANFATVNHLLINALVLEAFQEIIPGVKGSLVYFISHNIARKELLPDGHGGFAGEGWVHRKGATRAFPAKHPSLKNTLFAETGHPILLPGNPAAGSVIMVADAGAEKSAYSVNHGAGRCMGRKAADRALDQKTVDEEFVTRDILTNCRLYPKDEAPAAYKDFDAVLDSVKAAGLASEVARLKARFVIKDADMSLKGAA
jgi:tRNA-splicing ligase RtcB